MPHLHDKLDYVVEVYVVYHDRVLLQFHNKLSKWLPLGGHMEHEDPNTAAYREAREESGLDIILYDPSFDMPIPSSCHDFRRLVPPQHLNMHPIPKGAPPGHMHCSYVYFALAMTDSINPSPDESPTTFKWFSMTDLDDAHYQLQDDVKFYARDALEKLVEK